MKRLLIVLAVMFGAMAAPAAGEETLSGPATVRDAMTIAIGGARVRLAGIAIGEARSCGAALCTDAARETLAGRVEGRLVTCSKTRRLGHGYFLGRCSTEAGEDLALLLLGLGLAEPGEGAGPSEEAAAAAAKAAGKGQWRQ